LSIVKKRIKFQTFSQAWGIKEKLVKKIEKPAEELPVPDKVVEKVSKDMSLELPRTIPLLQSPVQNPEKRRKRQIHLETPIKFDPEKTISFKLHLDLIKWISIIYLVHLVLLVVIFLVLYAYKS